MTLFPHRLQAPPVLHGVSQPVSEARGEGARIQCHEALPKVRGTPVASVRPRPDVVAVFGTCN